MRCLINYISLYFSFKLIQLRVFGSVTSYNKCYYKSYNGFTLTGKYEVKSPEVTGPKNLELTMSLLNILYEDFFPKTYGNHELKYTSILLIF